MKLGLIRVDYQKKQLQVEGREGVLSFEFYLDKLDPQLVQIDNRFYYYVFCLTRQLYITIEFSAHYKH